MYWQANRATTPIQLNDQHTRIALLFDRGIDTIDLRFVRDKTREENISLCEALLSFQSRSEPTESTDKGSHHATPARMPGLSRLTCRRLTAAMENSIKWFNEIDPALSVGDTCGRQPDMRRFIDGNRYSRQKNGNAATPHN